MCQRTFTVHCALGQPRGVSLSDFALGELERVAQHPRLPRCWGVHKHAGGAQSTAIVAAIRAGRD